MIRKLSLRTWRNYETLDLELEPGTTFITARNGVGKTSLIQGIEWAMFGPASSIPAEHLVRKGSKSASASIEVLIDGGRILRIERTLTGKKVETVASVDGEAVTPDGALEALAETHRMAAVDLSRLAFVPAGSLPDYSKEQFHLRRHLCRLYGIDRLEETTAELDSAQKSVASEIRKARQGKAVGAAELSELRRQVSDADQAVIDARALVESLRDQVTTLRAEIASHELVEAHRRRQAAYAAALADYAATAGDALGAAVAAVESVGQVAHAIVEIDADVDDMRRRIAALQGRRDAITDAQRQLDASGADCPVCLRPLGEADVERAVEGHGTQVTAIDDKLERLHQELDVLVQRAHTLRKLAADAPAMPDPSPPPTPDGDPETAQARLTDAESAYAGAIEAVGAATARLEALQSRLAEDEALAEAQQSAIALYEREALLSAATSTFAATTRRLIEEQIDPLAREVARRWKMVFAGRRAGLTLDTDGRLFLEREGHQIPFEAMSAGERSAALITTRLLVLSATSASAFVCFDEPLEQLDPINRRSVALLLAQASTAIGQVLVTTFEEPLARRLAGELDDVHLVQVAADDN